jgi:hypothetical protein
VSLVPGTRCRSVGTIVFGSELFTVSFDSGEKVIFFEHEIEPVRDAE